MQKARNGLRKRERSRMVAGAQAVLGLGVLLTALPFVGQAAGRIGTERRDISALETKVDDIEANVRVTKYDSKEGEKIGRDFGTAYRFRSLTFQYKQPDKIRLQAKSPTIGMAVLIMNGPVRYYSIPRLNVHNRENLENAPSKRQSLLEYGGLIAPETLRFMQGHFEREEMLDGMPTLVYLLTYTGKAGASSYRCWIDPKTRVTVKREWLDSDNKLKATFRYQEPTEVEPGVWLPTHLEVKNADGVLVAATTLSDIKINQGLADDLFDTTPER